MISHPDRGRENTVITDSYEILPHRSVFFVRLRERVQDSDQGTIVPEEERQSTGGQFFRRGWTREDVETSLLYRLPDQLPREDYNTLP